MWQLCSKDYAKVNYYVEVKWIHIRIGELKGDNNYACEAIKNVYLEEQKKIEIIVHDHLHGIGKK